MPRRIRPPVDADAESVLDVIHARDVADLGVPDFTLEDLQSDWSRPGLALEHDARVAEGAPGAIRGYAILLGDDAVIAVHPEAEGKGNGTVLRRWAEARAAERGTAVLRQFAYGSNDGARRHLRDAGYDPAPLASVLADPAVEIVVHAGRQDVAILRREWRTDVTSVFDTQVAAGFAGFSAQAGYNGLLHDALRIRLSKTASFTRWDARPLTEEQIRYARGDVEHLLPLADDIRARLEATGRLEWAREECRAVALASDQRDPGEVWRRLPRVAGLDPRERAVARELAAWRERTAERENPPGGAGPR